MPPYWICAQNKTSSSEELAALRAWQTDQNTTAVISRLNGAAARTWRRCPAHIASPAEIAAGIRFRTTYGATFIVPARWSVRWTLRASLYVALLYSLHGLFGCGCSLQIRTAPQHQFRIQKDFGSLRNVA